MSLEKNQNEAKVQNQDSFYFNCVASKQTFKKVHSGSQTYRSTDSMDLDSIHTGESLFKTFTFETRADDDPDVKKCLSFWKSILEKNVRPVKCSLLKTSPQPKEIKAEKPQKADPCNQEDTQKMWMDIYKDLQRRNLDKIRSGKKQKYDLCEESVEDYDKEQEKADIKKLNDWVPPQGAKKINIDDLMKRSFNTGKKSEEDIKKQLKISKQKVENRPASITNTIKTDKNKTETLQTPKLQINKFEEANTGSETKQVVGSVTDGDICEPCQRRVEECEDSVETVVTEKSFNSINCDDVCSCHQTENNEEICNCGCGVDSCICLQLEKDCCNCDCAIDECICEKVDLEEGPEQCKCSCGLDDCICELFLPKDCKCGQEKCECDFFASLSCWTDSVDEPSVKNENTQTFEEVDNVEESVPKIQEIYCVICGHYNCFCNMEKKCDF